MRRRLAVALWCLLALTTSAQEVENEASPSTTNEKEKRLWGSKNTPDPVAGEQQQASSTASTDDAASFAEAKDEHGHAIPFVFKASGGTGTPSSSSHPTHGHNKLHYEPPQGFQITSRVYTDPTDKLAHFDNDSAMVFPYWECGVSGSTTVPIPLQHATVRHLLGGSQPNQYSGGEFGPYPQLVVALTSLDIVLNSGQVQTFHPGDVILLEDVVSGGHKLRGHDKQDMTVMILTLTQHYHQVGKDKTSLTSILNKDSLWKISPCPNGLEFSRVDVEPVGMGNKIGRLLRKLQPRSIRRYLLTVVGLSLSTVLGDFMGKVAPLWLAVVFGGGCFVTGGTLAFVKVGDKALDELEMWQERRQLRLQGPEETQEESAPSFESMGEAEERWQDGVAGSYS